MIREMLGDSAGRVIDIHTHILGDIAGPGADEIEGALSLARHYGIGRIVMLGNIIGEGRDHDPPPGVVAEINSHTLRAMAMAPGVALGFAYLNPANPVEFSVEEIDRCIVSGGMRGVKLWIAVRATDKRLDPLMERITEVGVPVIHHTWYKTVGQGPEESTPADLVDLARRHPGAKIVLAHLGGGRERGVLDLVGVPNVWYDTAGSQPEAGMVDYAVRHLGAERIVFGSDWPIRDYGVQLGRVLGADLTEDERALVLHGNAERLMGLEASSANRPG